MADGAASLTFLEERNGFLSRTTPFYDQKKFKSPVIAETSYTRNNENKSLKIRGNINHIMTFSFVGC